MTDALFRLREAKVQFRCYEHAHKFAVTKDPVAELLFQELAWALNVMRGQEHGYDGALEQRLLTAMDSTIQVD